MILYTDSTLIPTIREVLEVWEEISSAIVEVFSLVRSQSVHALKCLLLDAVRAEFHGDTHTNSFRDKTLPTREEVEPPQTLSHMGKSSKELFGRYNPPLP